MVLPENGTVVVSKADTNNAGTPDWLKEDDSPFGNEDVFSESTPDANNETHQPDWLQDATVSDNHNDIPTSSDALLTPAESEVARDDTPIPAPEPSEMKNVSPDVEQDQYSPSSNSLEDSSEISDDIPDWLRGAEVHEEPETNDMKIQAL